MSNLRLQQWGRYACGIAFVCVCMLAWTAPMLVHAQTCTGSGGFVPLECFEGSQRLEDTYREDDLGLFLKRVFAGAIALGAMLAVLRLAWAGFVYMSSDLWSSKQHARDIIQDTLLGLFLLLAIYIILYQINRDIVSLKFDPEPASSGQQTTQTTNSLLNSTGPNTNQFTTGE